MRRFSSVIHLPVTRRPHCRLVHDALPLAELRPRIALYGHDTLGLGHLRRNQALAAEFAGGELEADVLVVSGAAEAGRFERPRGVDVVVLPGVDKAVDGSYAPSHLRQSLRDVVGIRTAVASAALTAFRPDVFVVDKTPLGFERELAAVLPVLRRRGTRLVLGLRDVLDEPAVARRQWWRERCTQTVRALFDEVWVYGDRAVHDLVATCGMPPDVAARTRHLGYLSRRRPTDAISARPVLGRYVLALVGGGRDGAHLADAFAAQAVPGYTSVVVTGPYLPAADGRRLHEIAATRADLVVVDFVPDLSGWVVGASAVVAMAGANTVTELLDTDVPTLLVPRVRPRREQMVRAAALADRAAVEVADPDRLGPDTIARWLAGAVGRRVDRRGLDIDGLAEARSRVGALLGEIAATRLQETHDVAV